MRTISTWTGMLTVSFAMMGCATQNYDFAAVPNGSSRISQLVDDLNKITQEGEAADEELYDLSIVPLVHSRLHVFTESDEEEAPAGFVEADINSYLPLFGFMNGTVSQYNVDRDLLTRYHFDSSLWGAFRTESELIVTPSGTRKKTRHTFLWLFGWWGQENWHPTDEVALGNEVKSE